MNKGYEVNNIFNNSGETLNDIVSTYLISFLDKELNEFESDINDRI